MKAVAIVLSLSLGSSETGGEAQGVSLSPGELVMVLTHTAVPTACSLMSLVQSMEAQGPLACSEHVSQVCEGFKKCP